MTRHDFKVEGFKGIEALRWKNPLTMGKPQDVQWIWKSQGNDETSAESNNLYIPPWEL
jgi:hypothetical protein